MLRKTIVALFTIASVGMLAPDVASARPFGGGHAVAGGLGQVTEPFAGVGHPGAVGLLGV